MTGSRHHHGKSQQDEHLDLLDVVGGAGYERGRPEMAYFPSGKNWM